MSSIGTLGGRAAICPLMNVSIHQPRAPLQTNTYTAQTVCHLAQRFELGLHDELIFTELTAASVRALDPLLQTGLVDEAQAPCAVAWCDQRALVIPLTVTNPAGAKEYSQC